MDYVLLNDQVNTRLRELYPTSRSLTPAILEEMHIMLFDMQATYDEFYQGLTNYRRNEKEGSSFPPKAYDLEPYVLSARSKLQPQDTSSMMEQFGYMVARNGWRNSILQYQWHYDTKKWLDANVVNRGVIYSCFPEMFQQYLTILHSGEIIQALEFYATNAIKSKKKEAYKQLDTCRPLGNDNLKQQYPYFRDQLFGDKAPIPMNKQQLVKRVNYDHDGNFEKRRELQIAAALKVQEPVKLIA